MIMTQTDNFELLIAKLEQFFQLNSINSKPVLTIEEAALYTGRSTSNLYKLTSKNIIPHSKPYGSRIYFDRQELDAWMLQNPIKTASQIELETATYATINPSGRASRKPKS
jgi:excisionase family DNA binding protein